MPGKTPTLRKLIRNALGRPPVSDAADTLTPISTTDPDLACTWLELAVAADEYDKRAVTAHEHGAPLPWTTHEGVLAIFRSANDNISELVRLHQRDHELNHRHASHTPDSEREAKPATTNTSGTAQTVRDALELDLQLIKAAVDEAQRHLHQQGVPTTPWHHR